MSTSSAYIVLCPRCDKRHDIEVIEFELQPVCRWCGADLARPIRIEGFQRVETKDAT